MISIERLCISPGHRFFGHHGGPAGDALIVDVDGIECVAGRGLRGDRFFDFKPDYKGQITFFQMEVFEDMCASLGLSGRSASLVRRNAFTRGLDLDSLVGCEFAVQGVRFLGVEECRPCYWMDQAIGTGAESWLKGQGGLRAKILSDGWLKLSSQVEVLIELGERAAQKSAGGIGCS